MAESWSTKDAYFYDINDCLFRDWTPYMRTMPKTSKIAIKKPAVLRKLVDCHGKQLCYNDTGVQAQFAVRYNQETLTPEFTGHVLEPIVVGSGRGSGTLRPDSGIGNYHFVVSFKRTTTVFNFKTCFDVTDIIVSYKVGTLVQIYNNCYYECSLWVQSS